jgi:hypothetical protein
VSNSSRCEVSGAANTAGAELTAKHARMVEKVTRMRRIQFSEFEHAKN